MIATIDIETKTHGMPNPDVDEIQLVGIKDLHGKGMIYYYPRDRDLILAHLQRVNTLVGYNLKGYDVPLLRRFGLIEYRHVIVDLMVCIKRREAVMPYTFHSKSLKNVLETLGLPPKTILPKETFQKPQADWSVEERHEAELYLENDLYIEEQLYIFLDDYFSAWKQFIGKEDRRRHAHLVSTNGSYTYKAICHASGLREEYNDQAVHQRLYEGGFVAKPTEEEVHGNIICLDFASMYPHAYIQGNLYSYACKCCTKEEKWHGNELFPIKGYYCKKKRGKIEEAILRLYKLRQEYKAVGDQRQYAIKIIINTMYGISGNPAFKNVFNINTASDCTLIGRNCLKYTRDRLEHYGYKVLYSDTDSCYIIDDKNNEERVSLIADSIVQELKAFFPFPSDTFNLKIDERIKHIWFFKRNGEFKKKHYAYVTNEGRTIIKGLPIIKRDSSKLGQRLLKEVIMPDMKKGIIRKKKSEWRKIINKYLEEDLSLVGKHFYLKDPSYYKDSRCLPAVLSERYGAGRKFLIPNKVLGAGKSVKYCTQEEFDKKKLNNNMVILNKTYGELRDFTEGVWKHETARKTKDGGQMDLWDFG